MKFNYKSIHIITIKSKNIFFKVHYMFSMKYKKLRRNSLLYILYRYFVYLYNAAKKRKEKKTYTKYR